ncbi:MAG: hypothetical protein IK057_03965 [Clostridia bacterium]|nr:hypothetical protein [Clostridia bacterium]
MKKSIIYLITMLLLCGCNATGTDNAKSNTVTLINEVKDADIWILPKTEENLKTTVWGKATVSGIKINETCKAPLCEAGENGFYIIRMIDTDNIFYSVDDLVLKSGWTVRIMGDDLQSVKLEVMDESGVLKNIYDVFAASL